MGLAVNEGSTAFIRLDDGNGELGLWWLGSDILDSSGSDLTWMMMVRRLALTFLRDVVKWTRRQLEKRMKGKKEKRRMKIQVRRTGDGASNIL